MNIVLHTQDHPSTEAGQAPEGQAHAADVLEGEDPDENSPWLRRRMKIVSGGFVPVTPIYAQPVKGDPDFSDEEFGPVPKERTYVEHVLHF